MNILVTGCAGFIGSHLCEQLLKKNINILGIDNLNNYYNINQKIENLNILSKYSTFTFKKIDIRYEEISNIIFYFNPSIIIHLAAMAGIRNSIYNPAEYIDVNINGTVNLLNACIKNNIKKFIYASSSSVYGLNTKIPFSEHDNLNNCNSPYACSKLSMEHFCNLYSKLYDIKTVGLRFFTVYGPRGRPDMAPYKFINAILNNEEIIKYGDGTTMRDYTYISDIIDGIDSTIYNFDTLKNNIYNLGNNKPLSLNNFIELCEKVCGKKAKIKQIENQKGDVPTTYANITRATNELNYNPKIELLEGLKNLKSWLINTE